MLFIALALTLCCAASIVVIISELKSKEKVAIHVVLLVFVGILHRLIDNLNIMCNY